MTLGVVVGRFQIDMLHEGHKRLFEYVFEKHDQVLVVVGDSVLPTTKNNPLSYGQRRDMLNEYFYKCWYDINLEEFPHVRRLQDHPSDDYWSQNLDALIREHDTEAVLYHSRDSFKAYYTGEFPTFEVPAVDITSATAQREIIGKSEYYEYRDFRRGVIWANQQRFPTPYATVDAAVIRPVDGKWTKRTEGIELLVITKKGMTGLMLPGGFAEIGSTDEADALREVEEETGVIAESPDYVGSFVQNDWRYTSEVDEVRTRLFICDYVSGEPAGNDDADTARWVILQNTKLSEFNHCHHPLILKLVEYLGINLKEEG